MNRSTREDRWLRSSSLVDRIHEISCAWWDRCALFSCPRPSGKPRSTRAADECIATTIRKSSVIVCRPTGQRESHEGSGGLAIDDQLAGVEATDGERPAGNFCAGPRYDPPPDLSPRGTQSLLTAAGYGVFMPHQRSLKPSPAMALVA